MMKITFVAPKHPDQEDSSDQEALLVRAIPFVAGLESSSRQYRFPPSLIWESARQAADAWIPGIPALKFYMLDRDDKDNPTTVPLTADFMTASAQDADFQPDSDYPISASIMQFPSDWFVLVKELQAFTDWLFPPGVHDGACTERIELNLHPKLPSAILEAITPCVDTTIAAATNSEKTQDGPLVAKAELIHRLNLDATWDDRLAKIDTSGKKYREAVVMRGAKGKRGGGIWNALRFCALLVKHREMNQAKVRVIFQREWPEWADRFDAEIDEILAMK